MTSVAVGSRPSKKGKKAPRGSEALLADADEAFDQFLHETTIHGLRYLARDARRNCLDCLYWAGIVVAAFAATGIMLYRSFHEASEFPIITTVDTVSVKKVPFPAVTVDAGDVLNPWGYAERLLDLVDFECYDSPFDCSDRKAIRDDALVVTKAVVQRFFDVLLANMTDVSLEELKDLRGTISLSKDFVFPEFALSAALLARLIEVKSSRHAVVIRKLVDATAETFAMFTPTETSASRGWGTKYFYPVVRDEAAKYGVTEDSDEVQNCTRRKAPECPDTYNAAYLTMLIPFYVNRVPYEGLGAGELLSYFTRRVVSTGYSSKSGVAGAKLFLSGLSKNSDQDERDIEAYLRNIANFLSESGEVDISLYELTKLLDRPHYVPPGQASYAGFEHDCVLKQEENYMETWREYLRDRRNPLTNRINGLPCQDFEDEEALGIGGCCDLSRKFDREYDLISRVMKYSIQAPHFRQSQKEFLQDFKSAYEGGLPYKMKSYKQDENDTDWRPPRVPNPRIFMCRYNQLPSDQTDCSVFARSFTNEGVGYTFNNRHFWNKHREDNVHNQNFYQYMSPEPVTDFPDLIYPETSGSFYGLSVVLQMNKYGQALDDASTRKKNGIRSFKVSIHDPHKPADLRSEGINIEPGYSSTFLITPAQVDTSDGVKRLERERRNCRAREESDGLRIFKEYTQGACVFECQLEQATERCGCVPWNYPRLNDSLVVCDFMGVHCFETMMSNTTTIEQCDCEYDCDATRYGYSVSSTTLDYDAICDDDAMKAALSGPDRAHPPMFMRNYETVVNGRRMGEVEVCKENLRGMAFVNFQLAGQTVTQIKRGIRVTLADQISNFGGTIGLFTGMSIVSICEILFWGLKLLVGGRVAEEEEKEKEQTERHSAFERVRVAPPPPPPPKATYEEPGASSEPWHASTT